MKSLDAQFKEREARAKIKALGGVGILEIEDVADLAASTAEVLAFLLERGDKWTDAQTIRDIAGGSEGLRRMRELRDHGFVVEKRLSRNPASTRLFEYRLTQECRNISVMTRARREKPQVVTGEQPSLFDWKPNRGHSD